ncbi:DapH/DapD/GlmU-related protein [Pseudolysinimonas sp.]|uniref:DapH/DapD/GlmU-related protein n=1 Tax=Pseudolysinimonas sp. TaxID=2680009 RepID=UPI003F7FFE0F
MTAAWGHGLATVASDGTVLDAWYPAPRLGGAPDAFPDDLAAETGPDELRDVRIEPITMSVDTDEASISTADAYLRLHLLSHLLVRPNGVNLDGLMGHLPIVVWTNTGPVLPATFAARRRALQRAGVTAKGYDRIPFLLDYVVPERVRIADASRVRLGAHLAPGTTVMQEGFVHFNAGTLGTSMVEGRISAGVVVGEGSDVGGGASIMGTLSGGGTQRIVIGQRVLLGANSGVGISIGDDGIVEAGLYVTAGTRVTVLGDGEPRVVKALELSGVPGLLLRRNSTTGAVEALPRTGGRVALNPSLHP